MSQQQRPQRHDPATPGVEDRQLEQRLLERLGAAGSVLVAFSGGVDSSYLAWTAQRALGAGALAVTGVSPSVAAWQLEQARELAELIGIAHRLLETDELEDPRYRENTPQRCYFCKGELYGRLAALRAELGLALVVDGTNADDLGDWRPGRQAAEEHAVASPLAELGFDKARIRRLSLAAGLPSWDRPASPCLASRIPHFSEVTPARLAAVERAEACLRDLGYREFRVRHLGSRARVELAAGELPRALAQRLRVCQLLAAAGGFDSVELDPEPFRSGRLSRETRPAKA